MPQNELGEHLPQMHGADPYTLLGGLLLQLHQNDVRLRLDQPPNQFGINAAESATRFERISTSTSAENAATANKLRVLQQALRICLNTSLEFSGV